MKTKKNIKFRIISYQRGYISLLRLPYFYSSSVQKARRRATECGIQYFENTKTNKIYSATGLWWLAVGCSRKDNYL